MSACFCLWQIISLTSVWKLYCEDGWTVGKCLRISVLLYFLGRLGYLYERFDPLIGNKMSTTFVMLWQGESAGKTSPKPLLTVSLFFFLSFHVYEKSFCGLTVLSAGAYTGGDFCDRSYSCTPHLLLKYSVSVLFLFFHRLILNPENNAITSSYFWCWCDRGNVDEQVLRLVDVTKGR